MLLNPQHKKKLQLFWSIFAVLIVLSMVFASFAVMFV